MKDPLIITVSVGQNLCQVIVAVTFIQKLQGLLCRPEWKGGMLFETRSVHTFFMNQPLDVFYLNHDASVIHAIFGLQPWRISPIIPEARMVLEVPCGKLGSIEVGTHLQLQKPKGGLLHG